MAEMRRLFGVMRAEHDQFSLSPQPGLGQLARLLEQTRAAGLPVEFRVEGEPVALPPGVDLAAYRVIQEALTNALKHAGPARARVVVHYRDPDLELEVEDDGIGISSDGPRGGHGLVGMRERIALYGGVLETGGRPGGGFRVRARLPLREAAL
jgi:signal transduction histidine kinase